MILLLLQVGDLTTSHDSINPLLPNSLLKSRLYNSIARLIHDSQILLTADFWSYWQSKFIEINKKIIKVFDTGLVDSSLQQKSTIWIQP
ncbi:unnamed protein product [Lactuca virosa]|uniref:Uncharacterized protein n=1 Tax=Lactuca virosa TaxID=75947 RepID=A0AAU9M7N9_9ASTR|nr:unnamed protein product [Lactuca virosa]